MKHQRRCCARDNRTRPPRAVAVVELLEERAAPTDLGLTAFALSPDNPFPSPLPEPVLSAVAPDAGLRGRQRSPTDSEPALPLLRSLLSSGTAADSATRPDVPSSASVLAPIVVANDSGPETLFSVLLDGSALVAGPFPVQQASPVRARDDLASQPQAAEGAGFAQGDAVPFTAMPAGNPGTGGQPTPQPGFADQGVPPPFVDVPPSGETGSSTTSLARAAGQNAAAAPLVLTPPASDAASVHANTATVSSGTLAPDSASAANPASQGPIFPEPDPNDSFTVLSGDGPAGSTGTLVTGPDAGGPPLVRVFDPVTHAERLSFLAYAGTFHGGVRVATGDVNGDGILDIITGTGPGGGSQVRVFDGRTGNPVPGLLGSFRAYPAGFTDGVFVAAADVNGDGLADIITGTDVGSAPQVKVFSSKDGAQLASWFADDATLRGGVRVAAADVNGDGRADVITGDGPGSQPRVRVFDGRNSGLMYDFLAGAWNFQGGVYVAGGDLTGDGKAEIITGTGSGGRPEVQVYSGANLAMRGSVLALDASFTGGVRVAVADANGDGKLDVIAAGGPGQGDLRCFDGRTLARLNSFGPYGASYRDGLFAAGFARPAPPSPLDGTIVSVNIQNSSQFAAEPSTNGAYILLRTGDLSGPLTVYYTMSGTATNGVDYQFLPGTASFDAGLATTTVSLVVIDDCIKEGPEYAVLNLQPGPGYTVASDTGGSRAIEIADDDGPLPAPPPLPCGSDCRVDQEIIGQHPELPPRPGMLSEAGVRYVDGALDFRDVDLASTGFGAAWGQTRSWTNLNSLFSFPSTTFGNHTMALQLPYLEQDCAGNIIAVSSGVAGRYFDYNNGVYQERYFLPEQLTHDVPAN